MRTINKSRTFFLTMAVLLGTVLSAETHLVSSNADNGEGTLRQLIEVCLPGDSIVIPSDYTIVLQSEIAFDKSIAINGQGSLVKVTIPGVSAWRVFMIGTTTSTPKVVSMYNLRLEGGNPNAFGGVIYVRINHTFKMKNCTISKGIGSYAGGIFTHKDAGTSITLEDCTFSDCEATTNEGGALYIRGKVMINNCTFSNNKADLNGGAISILSAAPGSLISNCRFIRNSSHAPIGGAVSNYSSSNSVDLENCTFESNTNTAYNTNITGAGGFTIAHALAKSTLTNCTFYNNTGTSSGAIFNGKGTLNLVNCTFAGNSTPSSNGGAYDDINHTDAKTTMVNNIFAYNYNSTGLMDIYVSALGTVTGTNNVIGDISGSESSTLLNTVNYHYDPAINLFSKYTDSGDKKPLLETNGTISLAKGSVAINAGIKKFGEPELIPLKDQLGAIRPILPSVGSVEFASLSAVMNIEKIQLSITSDPISNLLYINGDNRIDKVDLIDMSGRRSLSVNNPIEYISLKGLSKGIYLVHVYTLKGKAIKKLIIN